MIGLAIIAGTMGYIMVTTGFNGDTPGATGPKTYSLKKGFVNSLSGVPHS